LRVFVWHVGDMPKDRCCIVNRIKADIRRHFAAKCPIGPRATRETATTPAEARAIPERFRICYPPLVNNAAQVLFGRQKCARRSLQSPSA
jgi:hypothetical protein